MGIQIWTDRTLEAHDQKKNKIITDLDSQVQRLTKQSTKLSEEKQEVERLLTECYERIRELVEKADKVEQESTERFHTILELRKEMSARDERIRELEAEMAAAAERDVKTLLSYNQARDTIKQLKAEAHALPDDALALLHKIAEGTYIDQRGGGKALVKQARDLIKQYDSASDK